jgi:arabinofuranosyltransferase
VCYDSHGACAITGSSRQPEPQTRAGVLLLSLLPLAIGAWATTGSTLDDAFISYRYAENLAHGVGLVFNPGEHVEGFSNPLWVLLLSAAAWIGIPAPLTGRLLGLLCAAGVVVMVLHAAERLRLSRAASLLAGLWISTSVGVIFYAGAGLETPLLLLELSAMAALLLADAPVWAGLCAATAAITRPEGILYVLPIAAWIATQRRWRSLPVLLLPALSLGLLALGRLAYFGSLLPNTFHAKIGDQASPLAVMLGNLPHTAAYVAHFARQQLALGLPLLLILPALHRHRSRLAPLLAVVLCAGVFCLYAGDDWMAFGRFCLPAFPALVVLMAAGADAAGRLRPVMLVVLGLCLLPGVQSTALGLRQLAEGEGLNPANHSRGHVAVGQWLAEHGQPGDRVVVNEIGAIGYFSGLPVTDLLGLIDPVIPTLAERTDLSFPEYVLADTPRFVLLNDLSSWRNPQMQALQEPLRDKMRDSGLYARRQRFPLDDTRALVLFEALPIPAPTADQGLLADYSSPAGSLQRVDAMINFHWQLAAPAAGLSPDGFSVRWQGCLTLTEPRQLIAGADDGMEIWLNGAPVVINTSVGERTLAPSDDLIAPGSYFIEVRYQDRANAAWALLAWTDGVQRPVAIPWTALSLPGAPDCP